MENYKMYVNNNLYSEFLAKNDSEAKDRVRILCLKNEYLYLVTRGVTLVGNRQIFKYKPIFNEWKPMMEVR